MIAEAVVVTGLPPTAFGVEPTPELGALILEVLHDQAEQARHEQRLAELRGRRSG